MLCSPSMPGRILRITILTVTGLLITYACGVRTMGTMTVYCCLIHLYCDTLAAGRSLLKKRLLIIAISIPLITALLFLFSLMGLHEMLRTSLVFIIGVPMLLGMNHHFELGFSEISQVVTVAILAVSFEGNRLLFLYRIAFTSIGILVSYLTYAYVFPLRHDLEFEREYEALRVKLCELVSLVYGQERGETAETVCRSCIKNYETSRKHLNVVRTDLHIKRQYRSWQSKIDRYIWEMEGVCALLKLFEQVIAHQADENYTADCRSFVQVESWQAAVLLGLSGEQGSTQADEQWLKRGIAQVQTPADLHMLCLLEELKSTVLESKVKEACSV